VTLTAPSLVVYADWECGPDGYPYAWHGRSARDPVDQEEPLYPAIKDYIREQAGHRCERCRHPYTKGVGDRGWSPCDEQCTHDLPAESTLLEGEGENLVVLSQWRILTVHHLNGVKADCRWWNLAALCQRCHLTIQGRVVMERAFILEHSDWMKPHAAGFYAVKYLNEDLTREATMARLDELLALERLA
jgi:hypothetical protein